MSGSLEQELQAHAAALRELARLLVGGQEAEDLVQDAALQALHRPPVQAAGLRGWLLGVLRHRASKHRRSEQRRQRRERAAPLPDPETTPLRIAEHKETLARLHGALLALPEPYLGTLLLRFFEDLTPTEIAANTRVPLATVKSRLQRGLALLRERLDATTGEWRRPLALAFGFDGALTEGAVAAGIGTGVIMASGMKVAVGGLVAGLGVAAWLWLGSLQSEQRASDGADASMRVAIGAQKTRPDREAALVADPASARRAVETERAEARPGYLRLRVVRAEDDAPLPGADVWYLDPDLAPLTPRRTQAQLDCEGDPFASLLLTGQHAVTDVHGEVDVPQMNFGTRIAAIANERTGCALLAGTPPDGGHVLRMAARPVVQVAVLHPDGRPAVGVPVAVIYRQQEEAADDVCPLGLTDGNGCLVVREPGALKRNATGCWLGIAAPGLQGMRVAFDPAAPPTEKVVLQLPPTGSIQLVAHDDAERPVTREFQVGIYRLLHDGKSGPLFRLVATDRSGRVSVPVIGLGERLRARRAHGGGWSVDFDGPVRAGECVTAVLRPADDAVLVSGRIVTETGAAAAGMEFDLRAHALAPGIIQNWSAFVTTGPDGEFVFCIGSAIAGKELRGKLTALKTRRRVDGRFAELRITVPAGVKSHDAGTVHMVSADIVMTGWVFTADGRPVDRARFDIDWQAGPGTPDGPDLQLVETPPAPVQIDEAGGFVLYAADGPAMRALRVSAPGCMTAKVPVVPGARDVRVDLAQACSLTVEIRYQAELRGPPIRAELVGIGSMDLLNDTGSARTCQWGPLASGNYRLAIWLLGGSEPLAERTVALTAEGSGRSRREVFDVRGLRSALVKVTSVTGELVKSEGILLTAAGSQWDGRRTLDAFAVRDGSATVVTSAAAMSFEVIVAGYAVQHFSGPVQDVELRLQPMPHVAVQVAGLEGVPGDCEVMLTAKDPERADFVVRSESAVGFGPGLRAQLWTAVKGGVGHLGLCRPCRVECALSISRGDKWQEVPLGAVSWAPGQERLSFAPDGDLLRAAIARLQ